MAESVEHVCKAPGAVTSNEDSCVLFTGSPRLSILDIENEVYEDDDVFASLLLGDDEVQYRCNGIIPGDLVSLSGLLTTSIFGDELIFCLYDFPY